MSSPPETPSRSRRYPLRRSPPAFNNGSRASSLSLKRVIIPHRKPTTTSRDASSHSQDVSRPVLGPLQQNLRRLPSRIYLLEKAAAEMNEVCAGGKRKRVASGSNENAQANGSGRQMKNGRAPLKRFRSSSYTSEEDHASSMDIDSDRSLRWGALRSRQRTASSSSMEVDLEEESEDEDDDDEESVLSDDVEQEENKSDDVNDDESEDSSDEENSDDHLLSYASFKTLSRLRKEELIRLYDLAGLSTNDNAESLTKTELVDEIIAARDDVASLPPSSPLGRGAGSSDYSSEGEVDADEDLEDSAASPKFLKRRATTNDINNGPGHVKRSSTHSRPSPMKNRSLSMGNLDGNNSKSSGTRSRQRSANGDINSGQSSTTRHSRRSSRSSPANSSSRNPEASTSSHQMSISSPPGHHLRSRKISAPTFASVAIARPKSKDNGKGKGKQVELEPSIFGGEESDLTELEELEAVLKPSPRRLRSKDKAPSVAPEERSKSVVVEPHLSLPHVETWEERRVTPMRKAKKKIQSMKEESDADTVDEEEEEEEEEEDAEREQVDDEDMADEDEVDELVSGTPPSIQRRVVDVRKTPVRRRLRPRHGNDPSDGDDEDEEGDDEQAVEDDEAEDETHEDEMDGSTLVTPRKLRSGKIVGEEAESDDVEMEDEDGEEEEEEEGSTIEEEGSVIEEEEESVIEEEDSSQDAEGDTDEEVMDQEEDVDLTIATAKTLVRLRRDDLIRLCESRALEPVGTKPQLAEALLQWRDRQNGFSSPSSTGTVRAPSTAKRTRHKKNPSTPVLLRSPNERVHLDEPRTPPVNEQEKELELDLGELGLEDREIPPEKLQKLEKIGSGGFKDVYIGKFKNRKIAIAEFRGQLSAMDIKELKLLGGFDHPNIVRFLGVSIPENTRETPVMIISELCTNGDLFDYIRNVNPPTLHKVLTIMLDIARGLNYLHERKPSVIHRDCKSSNILITSKGNAKIADFGLAKVKQSTRSMVRSLVGTVNWQAPELWHAHPKYNHKVDVFSCACVYWEMLQWHLKDKKFPWEGMNEHAIYDIVGAKKQRPSLSGLRKQWCPEIVDLVERMWAHDHQDRPTMAEVVTTLEDLVKMY